MKRDNRPTNNKGQAHGYWELYYEDNKMYPWFKGVYHNNEKVGLWKFFANTKLIQKEYHII